MRPGDGWKINGKKMVFDFAPRIELPLSTLFVNFE